MPRAAVSTEDFIRACQSSNSVAEVAEKTGMATNAISTRMSSLRRKGVKNLKTFGVKRLDVAKLSELAAESNPTSGDAGGSSASKSEKPKRRPVQ